MGKLKIRFYGKNEGRRGKKKFSAFIFESTLKEKLEGIYAPSALGEGKGYIFYGESGTGKTSVVQAIAEEVKDTTIFMEVSGSHLISISNLDKLLEKIEEAKKEAHCIVLIDEIDSFGRRREDRNDAASLTHFLNQVAVDGFWKRVTIIATANHLEKLDQPLMEKGHKRFSNCIKFSKLSAEECVTIMKESISQGKKLPELEQEEKELTKKIEESYNAQEKRRDQDLLDSKKI